MKFDSICVDGSSIKYKEYVYIIESKLNALFRTNIKTGETEYLISLKCKKKEELYRDAYLYKNYAWFIPWMAEQILCINLDTLDCKYYDIPYGKLNEKDIAYSVFTYFFSSVMLNEKMIFCIPTGTDTAILIDMEQQKIIKYEGIVDVDRENFAYGACDKEWIYMSPYSGDRMVAINYITGKTKEYPWIYSCKEYSGMTCSNGKLWFAPNKADNMLVFDLQEAKFEKIPLGEVYNSEFNYLDIFVHNEILWILPWWSKGILLYDIKTKKWKFREKDAEICWYYDTELRKVHTDDKIMFVSCRTGYISIYDEENDKFDNIPVKVDFDGMRDKIDISAVAESHSYSDYRYAEKYLGLEKYVQIINQYY